MTQCPICFGELEIREVAPCMDCGHLPEELEHLQEGKHTYDELEIVAGLRLVLCDLCQVDFGSYDPAYFGLPSKHRLTFQNMRAIRNVQNPSVGKDLYCQNCGKRLAFLKFVAAVRDTRRDA